MKHIVRNGIKLSAMTLGTAQIGRPYGVANTSGWPSLEKSVDMLSFALHKGVTSLDTARGYGEAEERIGAFLGGSSFQGEPPYITTKLNVGLGKPRPGGVILSDRELNELHKDSFAHRDQLEKIVFEAVEASLLKLRLSKVNCVLLHDPIEMMVCGASLAKVMGNLITAGYTDEVGVSLYHPAEVDAMLGYEEYTATQLPMSLFDQRMLHSGALHRLNAKNYAVFVRSVFLQGVFFLDPDDLEDPLLRQYAGPHIRTLQQLAQDEGMSVAQLAVSFARDAEGVSSLVLGCDTKEQVLENISLMEGPSMSKKAAEAARYAFKEVHYEEIMTVLRRPKA